jgi:hypothetical protein
VMIGRRAVGAGIATKLGNHSFRRLGSPPRSKGRRWRTTPTRQRGSTTAATSLPRRGRADCDLTFVLFCT